MGELACNRIVGKMIFNISQSTNTFPITIGQNVFTISMLMSIDHITSSTSRFILFSNMEVAFEDETKFIYFLRGRVGSTLFIETFEMTNLNLLPISLQL